MADYDVLDMAVMLRDAQRSLRKLFPDYETKAEPCRQLLRRMMDALQAVVDANGGECGDRQKIQVHSLWLTAAAKDLLDEEHAVSVADKIKELLK